MGGFPVLSLMILVPVVAGIACFFVSAQQSRWIALAVTLVDLVLGVVLWANYDIGGAQWQFAERADLFAGFSYAMGIRSEEHTSELQSLMRISYAVFCLKKQKSLFETNHTS